MRLIDLDEFFRQNCVDRMDGKTCDECKHHVLEVSCERLMEQPTAEKVGKWIPVSERLPEEKKQVLVCDHYEFIYIAEYEVFTDGIGRWSESTEYRFIDGVLAWMPLPEPWRGEED